MNLPGKNLIWCLLVLAVMSAAGIAREPRDEEEGTKRGTIDFEPCELPGYSGKAFAAAYQVYEDREKVTGRKIDIHIIIIPALSEKPEPDPFFYFEGGPGQGPSSYLGYILEYYQAFRAERDLIFIDQRGTGRSNPLPCPITGDKTSMQTYLADLLEPGYVAHCREYWENKVDLTLYTTSVAADDIDEIRAAMGYTRINISGGSYGTRLAMEYLRRHEETVRTAFLFGVVSPTQMGPASMAKDAEMAMDDLIAACSADPSCSKTFPNFKDNLRKVLDRVRQEPVAVEVDNPWTKQKEKVSLRYGPFVTGLRSLLYSTTRAARVPLLIELAANGDFAPLALYTARYMRGVHSVISDGMYLSVTCSEDIPFMDPAQADRDARGTFLGDYRVRVQSRACALWPRGKIPPDFHQPLHAKVPVLLVSGGVDPATPPHWGRAASLHMTNKLLLSAPNASHNLDLAWPCVASIAARFINNASFEDLDTSCLRETKRPPFLTDPVQLRQPQ